jgi:hypothetical protein
MSRYIVSPHAQRTDGWYQDRAGRLNGSEVAAIYATIKTGEAAARRNLRLKLVLERITGKPQRGDYINAAMQRGIDCEPLNRQALEVETGLLVEELGYCYMPDLMVGCSLDGRVEDAGLLGITEFKCPESNTHLEYLREGVLPSVHTPQVTHNVWVTGADFCYFQSWDDRFPEAMQVFRLRVKRADLDIAGHEKAVLAFLAEVVRDEAELRKQFDPKAA